MRFSTNSRRESCRSRGLVTAARFRECAVLTADEAASIDAYDARQLAEPREGYRAKSDGYELVAASGDEVVLHPVRRELTALYDERGGLL